MAGNPSWNMDDLNVEGGLSTDLFNLSGLGNDISSADPGAYKMSEVLDLPIFKENSPVFGDLADTTSDNHQIQPVVKQEKHMISCNHSSTPNKTARLFDSCSFYHTLAAPTAPGKKMGEDTLTYLNQGQSYLVELKYLGDLSRFEGCLIKSKVKLTFYERKVQRQEAEKFEEWRNNRPLERILEIDVPMSNGLSNIRSEGHSTNAYTFEWNPEKDTKLYIIINCVSSEFTKGKSGGESGVPLQLQIETQLPESSSNNGLIHCACCQIKVFKSKGADRKHKNEMQKLENKSQDEIGQFQMSNDVTHLKEKPLVTEDDETWMTPKQISPRSIAVATPVSSPGSASLLSTPSADSQCASVSCTLELTSKSSVEETRAWLQENRFAHYLNMFTNFTGSDLLRLSRDDTIQLLGPADGIRLHNALQSRATRPLLTIYISLESTQQDSGMKEYHGVYLEALTVNHLTNKLAKKCSLADDQIVAIYRQGPTGIYILVDDQMIRNFGDEAHFVLQLLRERDGNTYRIILK
ncbi:transcription factor CP2-like isoform X2 [Actinia tenebrosa]|uniref:Transcription factor CP2-like isoform X2 n=1 Tax=Actinia tenebrosa TaxID=6105 RepID=A0A6P8I014_ACTTE|nr:transcription factor CP2-like isoform X2 [Actinia tenebrosa]